MDVTIERAAPADAKRLAEVFNLSFYDDYLKYGDCPGYGKTEQDMLDGMGEFLVYKIVTGGETVGVIAVSEQGEGDYFLGALGVIPAYANRGIGQRAMGLLDLEFPGAKHWALETPADKAQNHHFYQKLGYRVTGEYMDGDVRVSCLERTIV